MHALFNVGNSFTQLVPAAHGRLTGDIRRLRTGALLEDISVPAVENALRGPCLVGCVVPAVRQALTKRAGVGELRFLSADLIDEVDFSEVDASTLGADRMANAVAAVMRGRLPAIVLDCGTCITTEVLDGESRFLGGAILPGRGLSRQALRDYTGQLPAVAESTICPRAVGRRTAEAILAGVDLGILGSVERILRESRMLVGGGECVTYCVGGDADYFCAHMDDVVAGGAAFTLTGLAAVAARIFA